MNEFNTFLERNQVFAANYEGELAILPRFSTVILTCVDARIDPAHFLGLELGDALVIRNAGARITHDVEMELGVLWGMASQMAGENFKGMSLAIIHHTDCGYERLSNPQVQQMLSRKLGVEQSNIAHMGISDHLESIKSDIVRLQQSSLVPNQLQVSGYIYDVHDGHMNEAVPVAKLSEKTA